MLCWSKLSSAPRSERASAWRTRARRVGVQAAEIHALFEIDLHLAGRLNRAVPAVVRIDVAGQDDLRVAAGAAGAELIVTVLMVVPRWSCSWVIEAALG